MVGMSVTAYAAPTETLLTTITATAKEQASYSTANVATVSFSYSQNGSSAYLANWGWWGYGWTATVNVAEGYTITKCVFYDDANRTATDSEAPFVVETTEEDKTPRINGTPIDGGNMQSKGITKIEVYGYVTPTETPAPVITLRDIPVTYDGSPKNLILSVEYSGTEDLYLKMIDPNSNPNSIYWTKYTGSSDLTNVFARTNAGVYRVSYFLGTPENWEEGTYVGQPSIVHATPRPNNFTFTAPNSLNYDGTAKTATVTTNDGVNGMGDVTVRYYSDEDRDNEVAACIDPGTYYVGIDVDPGKNYTSEDRLYDDSWKFTIVSPHTHSFTYSADGATITAECSVNGCPLTADPTLTIAAPTLTTYGGTGEAGATLIGADAFNAATDLGLAPGNIQYSGTGTTTYAKTTTPPTAAGTYKAEITAGTATAYVEYTIAKADPSYTVPTGLTATYGQTLAKVTLPDGWAWADSTQSVGNVVSPAAAFKAKFTPDDTTNYNTVENIDVTVTVNKADPTVTAPTPNSLTYNGSAQALVTGGSATGGTVQYSTTETGTYSETIPTGTAVGDYTVWYKVVGDANHNDTTPASVGVTIAPKTVTAPTIELSQDTYTYDGTAKQPTVTVKFGSIVIPAEEYTVNYYQNVNAGTAAVGIADKTGGNYIVSGEKTFTISPKEVNNPTIELSQDTYTYDSTAKQPTVTVKDGTTVISAEEYNVEYSNNTNAGTATVTITDKDGGNYTVSGTKTFTITAKELTNPTITLSPESFTYDGSAKQPTVTVKDGTTTIPASEYNIDYSNNTNAGTATVTITDKTGGNYTVSGTKTFTITAKELTNPTITLSPESFTYDGTAKEPTVTVKDGTTVISAEEYNVEYSNNTNAGTATVTITDKTGGNYTVSGTKTFTIGKAEITVSAADVNTAYDGAAHGITVNVTAPASGYTIKYGTTEGTYDKTASPTITNVADSPLTVYYQVTADNYETLTGSATVTLTKAAQSAPVVSSTNETVAGKEDGTITGVTAAMEYKLSTEEGYTPVANGATKIEGLAAGTYNVRYAADANHEASPAADVIINTGSKITVQFNADGGTPEPAAQQFTYGQKVSKPETDPTKTGYTFKFWSADGETEYDFSTELTANITLKAIYKANSYTITFDTDGGSKIDAITQDYGTAVTKPADPTKTGYTFVEWDKDIPETMPAEDMTIKAKWKINQYTITFVTGGGTAIAPITQDYGTAITKPANPTWTGYVFTGWDKIIPATMPAYDMTITAQWRSTAPIYVPTNIVTPTNTTTTTTTTTTDTTPDITKYTITGEQDELNESALAWDAIPNASAYSLYIKVDGKYVFVQDLGKATNADIVLASNGKYYVSTGKDYTIYEYNEKTGKLDKTGTLKASKIGNIVKANNVTEDFMVKYTVNGKESAEKDSYKVSVKIYYKPAVKITANKGSITLKWNKVPEATKYRVYKYVNGKLKLVTETTKRSVKINGTKAGKEYTYAVKAYVDGKWTKVYTGDLASVTAK